MQEFIGQFHPLLLHLPIGILVLALVFWVMSRFAKWEFLQKSLPLVLLLGALSAAMACLTGWLLSRAGGYGEELVQRHQWSGIGLAVLSFGLYFASQREMNIWLLRPLWLLLTLVLVVTGHWGGSLTHGEDYLSWDKSSAPAQELSDDPAEVQVFADLVDPVLEAKCYACHSAKKQKGLLRLDSPEALMAGGEHGPAIDPENPSASLLLTRIHLPEEEEEHMPPKGRPQLSSKEQQLIVWWVEQGASFEAKMTDLRGHEAIWSLVNEATARPDELTTLAASTPAAEGWVIDSLNGLGMVVVPISAGSPLLSVNALGQPLDSLRRALLGRLAKQVVWLKLGGTGLQDEEVANLMAFDQLRILHLDNNPLSDQGLDALAACTRLERLNLSFTQVSGKSIEVLGKLPALEAVYLFESRVDSADQERGIRQFPAVKWEFGGYGGLFSVSQP